MYAQQASFSWSRLSRIFGCRCKGSIAMPMASLNSDMLSGPVNPYRVEKHALDAAEYFCDRPMKEKLRRFFQDPVTTAILQASPEVLNSLLVEDAYKPTMHNMYAQFLNGIDSDFVLHVRKAPIPLSDIRKNDPELWSAFEKACQERLAVYPYPSSTTTVLQECFHGFSFSDAACQRNQRKLSIRIEWQEVSDGELIAVASDHVIDSSHVETTLTQLVQEVSILAQLRQRNVAETLKRKQADNENIDESSKNYPTKGYHSSKEDKTEAPKGHDDEGIASYDEVRDVLLGNSLARLAIGVEFLNDEFTSSPNDYGASRTLHEGQTQLSAEPSQTKVFNREAPSIALFAGRRSSSRRYLLLQNWYCALNLHTFVGTSSVFAVTILGELSEKAKGSNTVVESQASERDNAPERRLHLVGTLAHEVPMVLEQLIGESFDGVFSDSKKRAQVTALLSHLLILRANGGLAKATALSDTFGTRGFVRTSLGAKIPAAFKEDMSCLYPEEWSQVPKCIRAEDAKMFDLFRVWRMDSGDYASMATLVRDAWDERWTRLTACESPPEPSFIHSNMSSYEEVASVSRLPDSIRPSVCAFGTLADGYLPCFPWEEGMRGVSTSVSNGPAASSTRSAHHGHSSSVSIAETGGHDKNAKRMNSCGGVVPPPLSSSIKMASVVMKALQARRMKDGKSGSTLHNSCGKLGDDIYSVEATDGRGDNESGAPQWKGEVKVQVDPRLHGRDQKCVIERLQGLADMENALGSFDIGVRESQLVSEALNAAYIAVTREGVLM